jgi:hypothetical protein
MHNELFLFSGNYYSFQKEHYITLPFVIAATLASDGLRQVIVA